MYIEIANQTKLSCQRRSLHGKMRLQTCTAIQSPQENKGDTLAKQGNTKVSNKKWGNIHLFERGVVTSLREQSISRNEPQKTFYSSPNCSGYRVHSRMPFPRSFASYLWTTSSLSPPKPPDSIQQIQAIFTFTSPEITPLSYANKGFRDYLHRKS